MASTVPTRLHVRPPSSDPSTGLSSFASAVKAILSSTTTSRRPLFSLRRLDLDTAMARASKVVGARIAAVPIPIAEAAVDVDKVEDLTLVRRILYEGRAKSD